MSKEVAYKQVDIGDKLIGDNDPIVPKKNRARSVITAIIIVLFVIVLVISATLIFHNYYYTSIFVNGTSMYPTLNSNYDRDHGNNHINEVVDYGIINSHYSTIGRFQIVATYYDTDYDSEGNLLPSASLKIKRVMVLPGEEFSFDSNGLLYVNGEFVDQTFYSADIKDTYVAETVHIPSPSKTLTDDQYWVMGDNRGLSSSGLARSSDSQYNNKPVLKSYIVGVLKAIEGTCTLASDSSTGQLTCVNRTYHWPVFF